MSVESAKSFFEKISTDSAFKNQVLALEGSERTEFVKGAGFDFTFTELQEVSSGGAVKADGELSPEDLDQIAAACIGIAAVSTTGAIVGSVVGTIVGDSVS